MLSISRLTMSTVAIGALLGLTLGCGGSKKSSNNAGTQQPTVRAEVASAPSGNGVVVTYTSDIEGATFECAVDVNGAEGSWNVCPPNSTTVLAEAGVVKIFKVKAISPAGAESKPFTWTIGGAEDAARTVILNKQDFSSVVTQSQITLQFGVNGSNDASSEYTFQCSLDNEPYALCQDRTSHTLSGLTDGQHTLRVQALQQSTGALVQEDALSFEVRLGDDRNQGEFSVQGVDQLRRQPTGQVQLSFEPVTQGALIYCSLNGQSATLCTNGYPINLGMMSAGQHYLDVRQLDYNHQVIASRRIDFCAGYECDQGQGPGNPGQDVGQPYGYLPQEYQLGNLLKMIVPQDMYIRRYTQNNWNQGQFLQIMNYEDPSYPIINNCQAFGPIGNHQGKVKMQAPNGRSIDYCLTTPPGLSTDGRIELSNGPQAGGNSQRIVQVFSYATRPFVPAQSVFRQICANDISRNAVISLPVPAVVHQDERGFQVVAHVYRCQVIMNLKSYTVVGFTMAKAGALPEMGCMTQAAMPQGCGPQQEIIEAVFQEETKEDPRFIETRAIHFFKSHLRSILDTY